LLPFVVAAIGGLTARRISRLRAMTDSSDQRFHEVLDSMAEAVLIYSADGLGGSRYCNEAGAALHGVSREVMEGDTRPRNIVEYLAPSGERAVFSDLPSIKTFQTGEPQRNQLIGLRRGDGSISWVIANAAPLRGGVGEGDTTDVIVTYTDITERRTLEQQLVQAQKLEAIGQLAAGIAHEINTPVQFVGDNTRFARDSTDELLQLVDLYEQLAASEAASAVPDVLARIEARRDAIDLDFLRQEIPAALDQAMDGTQRISEIVRAMKEFSHPGTSEKVPTDLNSAIRSTATVARNEWKYVAELELAFDEQLPLVACLPGELNQVVLNLIVNAAQALAEGGGQQLVTKGTIRIATAQDGDDAVITISDSGPGIPDEVRDRIFEPFFTTKEVGKGTGQGLAIARSVVVDKHGGSIAVDSAPGRGTTFTIRLPIEEAADAEAA
jgi:PAS domain S-box-containing protein